jgi:hypothetical protein
MLVSLYGFRDIGHSNLLITSEEKINYFIGVSQ